MGQYYYLTNHTKNETKSIGPFEGRIKPYLEKFDWEESDWIEVKGDYGANWHINDPYEVPEDFVDVGFTRDEWLIILYAAKRAGVDPETYATQYLIDGEEPEDTSVEHEKKIPSKAEIAVLIFKTNELYKDGEKFDELVDNLRSFIKAIMTIFGIEYNPARAFHSYLIKVIDSYKLKDSDKREIFMTTYNHFKIGELYFKKKAGLTK